MMRILVDECADLRLLIGLRAAGHDVVRSPHSAGIGDHEVLAQAVREQRVLVAEDLDFGNLVIRERRACAGVILIRDDDSPMADLVERVVELVRTEAEGLYETFVVVTPTTIRARPLAALKRPAP